MAKELTNQDEVLAKAEAPKEPEQMDEATRKLLEGKIDQVLQALTAREFETLKLRHGVSGGGYTYTEEEVARIFQVTRERLREVEARALGKLKAKGILSTGLILDNSDNEQSS